MLTTKITSTAIALVASASFAFAGPLAPVAGATKNVGTYQKTVGKLKAIKAENPCPSFEKTWNSQVEKAEKAAEAKDQKAFNVTVEEAGLTYKKAELAGCAF